ncbi:MAG TPA: apolipoprotein N-acyltransferase [Opitutaceae bacterium]|nr:apolipoprotein N-acyltransferase [Opitutaceae bacterium]
MCLTVYIQETINRAHYKVSLGKVAFVQPNIPATVKWDPAQGPATLEILEKLTTQAAAMRPQLILWPEASTPWALRGDDNIRTWTESLVAKTRVPLLLGSLAIEQLNTPAESWYNAAFVVDPISGTQPDYYAKQKLVPFGEYVPFRPLLGWLEKVVPVGSGDIAAGVLPRPLVTNLGAQPVALGPLICYEDIFPSLARDNVLAGADVLVVLTNNGWFGEGAAAYQHAAHSVLRAVETRRPVLRAGNAGWSGWIDEFGAVRSVATDAERGIYFRGVRAVEVTRDFRWIGRKSFYVEHGDWFVVVCAFLVAGAGFMIRFAPPPEEDPVPSTASDAPVA